MQTRRFSMPRKMSTAQLYPSSRQVVYRKQPTDIEEANPTNTAFKKLRVAKAVGCDFDCWIEYAPGSRGANVQFQESAHRARLQLWKEKTVIIATNGDRLDRR